MAIQEIDVPGTWGLQARVGNGPGRSKFFAFRAHGGYIRTWKKAKQAYKELQERFGDVRRIKGRKTKRNKSGIPGMHFEWRRNSTLYLAGNYTDNFGMSCSFAYSVAKHGFEGVLAKALEIRVKYGAPPMTLEEAKAAILQHYQDVSGGQNP